MASLGYKSSKTTLFPLNQTCPSSLPLTKHSNSLLHFHGKTRADPTLHHFLHFLLPHTSPFGHSPTKKLPHFGSPLPFLHRGVKIGSDPCGCVCTSHTFIFRRRSPVFRRARNWGKRSGFFMLFFSFQLHFITFPTPFPPSSVSPFRGRFPANCVAAGGVVLPSSCRNCVSFSNSLWC